ESPTERALPTRVLCARQRRQSSSGVVPATSGAAHRSDPWAPAGAGKGLPQPSPAWHSDSVHTSSGAAAATIGAAPVRPTAPARYAVGMFGTSLPINMFLAFMAYFYINDLGMSTRAYAAVLAVYAV